MRYPHLANVLLLFLEAIACAAFLFVSVAMASTQNTTLTMPPNSLGLVAHWTFDGKDMINNVADTSGQGNNDYLVNFTSTSSSATEGVIGQALSFNGTNQYVNVPNSSSLNPNVITVSFWVKSAVSSQNSYSGMVNKRFLGNSPPHNDWAFEAASSGSTYEFCIANTAGGGPLSGQWCLSNGTLSKSWTHIVGTYDGATQKLYENGSLVASQSVSITLASSTLPVAIGWDNSTGGGVQYFNGSIDDVRIYDRALSAADVEQLYKLGR